MTHLQWVFFVEGAPNTKEDNYLYSVAKFFDI